MSRASDTCKRCLTPDSRLPVANPRRGCSTFTPSHRGGSRSPMVCLHGFKGGVERCPPRRRGGRAATV